MRSFFFAFLGLFFGSFSNVYFYRIPQDLSCFKPRSFCPQCRSPILWFDNVPVLSFLVLRGKCRSCHSAISLRYPLNEILCGLLFFLVAHQFKDAPLGGLVSFLFFFFLLYLIGGIDLVTYLNLKRQYGIIPDPLVILLAVGGLVHIPFNPYLQGSFWFGISSALGTGSLLLLFRYLSGKIKGREALGMGDVKMLSAMALWLGWKGVLWTVACGSLVGSVTGLFLIFTKKIDWQSGVPYGPFLALGSLSTLLLLP